MSSGDVSSSSEISNHKQRRLTWFGRRRRPSLPRFGRCSSRKKKQSQSSLSSVEALSTTAVETQKEEISDTSSGDHDTNKEKKNDSHGKEDTIPVSNDNSLASMECPLCLTSQPMENFPVLSTCQHRSCLNCLRQYLAIEISESRVNLMCPECQEKLHPTDMRAILENEPHLMVKWEEFTLRRTLSVDPDCRWCPAPDCGYAVIAYGCASCPRIVCQRPGCNTEFCYHCRQEWHHNLTCDSAHLQRTKQLRIRSNSTAYSQGSTFHDEIKPCPKCGALIVKMNDGSCNHMTCTVCEVEFCWLCLQEITDLHYLSPSGCTFWGKKPWSRKKKILWQLGLLIGAPLGIGLVAGVAVPAIIFGLPVWVARRLIAQFENRDVSKFKRNLIVATCVTGSVIFAPALAALAVGVGVPVMLLYVYGVVPISLCRTGSYGLRDRDGPAGLMLPTNFRFDLVGSGAQPGTSSPDDGSNFSGQPVLINSRHGPTNPSIGEASVGGMTMGSFNTSRGSNMDKAGRIDADGASTVAMAGMSITGSLSGISGAGTVGANRAEMISKDSDQHSTHTQISVGSAPNFTSVQVHMNDNVSEHSAFSFSSTATAGSTVKKSYSSKPIGAKRKTKQAKRSSSVNATSAVKNESGSHGLPVVADTSVTTTSTSDQSALTIVNECTVKETKSSTLKAEVNKVSVPVTTLDDRSDSSSCGSQSQLLPITKDSEKYAQLSTSATETVYV
ncbi:E3 ubiquitin-protein ligase RNF19A-like isoform X1 [Clavelina lepadiformis]|uniref:E3 ubiquitin-protein ligase RNF19A-like isoform X1 n=1 Tax=Clavelina lepadiformis TaxID=159417 RepID=UPI00404153C1